MSKIVTIFIVFLIMDSLSLWCMVPADNERYRAEVIERLKTKTRLNADLTDSKVFPLEAMARSDENLDLVKVLLTAGSLLIRRNSGGQNVFHIAATYNSWNVLQELCLFCFKNHAKSAKNLINSRVYTMRSALDIAIRNRALESVQVLLSWHADVNRGNERVVIPFNVSKKSSHNGDVILALQMLASHPSYPTQVIATMLLATRKYPYAYDHKIQLLCNASSAVQEVIAAWYQARDIQNRIMQKGTFLRILPPELIQELGKYIVGIDTDWIMHHYGSQALRLTYHAKQHDSYLNRVPSHLISKLKQYALWAEKRV